LNNQVRCPFQYIEKKLWEARNRIPRTQDDRPVVPFSFCAYQSQAIGADHVLNGVIKNSMEACAWILPESQRKELDLRLRSGLNSNGLPRQHRIYNLTKDKFGLYSCSLSDCSAIFSIFPPIIEALYRPDLIGLTYFWPRKGIDSDADFEYVLGKYRNKYYANLLSLAKEFLVLVNNASKLNIDVFKIIDKPNVHRVLELYVHTIPAFGHVRHVQELTFEHMHQSLKRIWEKHNASELHLDVVKESLFNDYIHRLFQARKRALSQDTSSDNTALNDILKLLHGRDTFVPTDTASADIGNIKNLIGALFNSHTDRALEYRLRYVCHSVDVAKRRIERINTALRPSI